MNFLGISEVCRSLSMKIAWWVKFQPVRGLSQQTCAISSYLFKTLWTCLISTFFLNFHNIRFEVLWFICISTNLLLDILNFNNFDRNSTIGQTSVTVLLTQYIQRASANFPTFSQTWTLLINKKQFLPRKTIWNLQLWF